MYCRLAHVSTLEWNSQSCSYIRRLYTDVRKTKFQHRTKNSVKKQRLLFVLLHTLLFPKYNCKSIDGFYIITPLISISSHQHPTYSYSRIIFCYLSIYLTLGFCFIFSPPLPSVFFIISSLMSHLNYRYLLALYSFYLSLLDLPIFLNYSSSLRLQLVVIFFILSSNNVLSPLTLNLSEPAGFSCLLFSHRTIKICSYYHFRN